MTRTMARMICAGAVLSATAAAPAQTARYLGTDTYAARVGDRIPVRVEQGPPVSAVPVAWPGEQVRWFFYRAGGAQDNQDVPRPARPGENFVIVPLAHADVAVIGMDFKPVVRTIAGADFRKLADRALPGAAAGAADASPGVGLSGEAAQVRVRRIESAKLLVRVTADDGERPPSATATSKTGQKAEIRLVADPTALGPGSDVPVRIYVDGEKAAAARVRATAVASASTREFVTDSSGFGFFRLDEGGLWRLDFEYLRPVQGDPQADCELYIGTLTFEAGKAGAGK